jgi:hypothetical protein
LIRSMTDFFFADTFVYIAPDCLPLRYCYPSNKLSIFLICTSSTNKLLQLLTLLTSQRIEVKIQYVLIPCRKPWSLYLLNGSVSVSSRL